MKKTKSKKPAKKKPVKVSSSKTKTVKKVKTVLKSKSKKIVLKSKPVRQIRVKSKTVNQVSNKSIPVKSKITKQILPVKAEPLKVIPQNNSRPIVYDKVKTILITQPKPESDKNSFFYLTSKYKVEINFQPFIHLEGIDAIAFRKFKINPAEFQAVIFTSRNAIDHFFKLIEDLRCKMSQETKYYCMTEAIALYMQKYILYRKRKVFYGDGTMKGLIDSIVKHRDGERYLIPGSDNSKSDIGDMLKKHKYDYREAVIFKTVPVKILPKEINKYDMIVFFSPPSVNALLHNVPNYKQGKKVIGGFGPQTTQAIVDSGLRLDINAPSDIAPSMSMAIDKFLSRK